MSCWFQRMDAVEKQLLLDENARLRAEIAILRQTIDALSRRIFGSSSEKLDAAQLELLLDPGDSKKAPAADPADPGPAVDIRDHKKRPQRSRSQLPAKLTECLYSPHLLRAD